MATAVPPTPAAVEADLKTAEKTISGWHINGWLAIAIALVANLVGCTLHV
jgi:hypothetical protein